MYVCHQNQNAKNIDNFTTLLKPRNIGTHLKGIETSFQVVLLFLESFHFRVSYITFWNFLKIPSVCKGLKAFFIKYIVFLQVLIIKIKVPTIFLHINTLNAKPRRSTFSRFLAGGQMM
jgi:hypothetical protein